NAQVWKKVVGSDTYVAVYNMGSSTTNITVNWSSVGVSGSQDVRDVDARGDLGNFNGSWTASNVPSHGSRLIKIG
ncbi:MAG TPA: glycoside hydrolase family 27 protein, partial [Pseudonocardiaceae bacterium]|nr:glycoside hydrolase family 27 protein [Pseudonocardiaceae bacterium]